MAEHALKNGGFPGAVEDAPEARSAAVAPRVDVLETENEFVLLVDLPGVKPEDADVRFEKGELILHGRRGADRTGKEPVYREYEATVYHRAFTVAETVAADRITAELKDGVLNVRLPKVEAVKPKRIAVRG